MVYCTSKRVLIMSSGLILIIPCLILWGIFGSVYSNSLKNNVIDNNNNNNNNNNFHSRPFTISIKNDNKQLELIHLVFRHGERTPADTYPNDPYINETFYPNGWGQLTIKGKQKLYETGKWLRNRYNEFLGTFYYPDYVHAQSTGVSRTHMSLALVLASLWPPKNTPTEWNRNLNWQPIPIFSEPLNNDTLLLVRTSCPRYYENLEKVFQLPEIKSVLNGYEQIYEQLTNITGLKIATPDDVQSLYSTLKAEHEYGLKLPPWTRKYYPEVLEKLTELSYIFNVYTNYLKSFKGGPFLRKMFNEWQQKRDNNLSPKNRKMYIYTGHDSTIVNILSALNVWEPQLPNYGIMGIFELYKDITTGEYGVQIYLKNSTTKAPYELTIPGCDFYCPIDKVFELTKSIISEVECKAEDPNFTEPELGGP